MRHGESEENIGSIIHGSDSPLTENGRKQAEFVAERFLEIPIDFIISSTYGRARETADIVNTIILKPIDYSDLFVERRNPSEIINTPKDGPIATKIRSLRMENLFVPDWRHSDEENFDDFKKRGLTALDFILSLRHENVLVVTHGLFLRMLVSCMILGEEMTSREYYKLRISLETRNTGVTLCEYKPVVPNERDNPWHVIAWNDHAHLG
ncbi:MAG: histidine phosphatase family protein [Patescibacteria group bacterium]